MGRIVHRNEQQFERPLRLDSPLTGKVKGDRYSMVHSFFLIDKRPRRDVMTYSDGLTEIIIDGTKFGIATVYDKDILIYAASLLVERKNRGDTPSPILVFTAHDLCRIWGIEPGGGNYQRIKGALERLRYTFITTNVETGGCGAEGAFSWLSEYHIAYERDAHGKKVMRAIRIILCDWLYRAIQIDNKILTYHRGYFKLGGLERRLYEIARAHCGADAQRKGFRINIEKLRRRIGSSTGLKQFKHKLLEIESNSGALLEYGLKVVEPKNLQFRAPKPIARRQALKDLQVCFWRLDQWRDYTPMADFPESDDV
jgi:plasmid replication initiation protein